MTNNVNPLLQRLQIPGETVRLPSRGLFYTNGELSDDVIDGEVHVYPMTTYDEIVLKTPDMLLTGKAIVDVFSRRIPQIQKPYELLSKDVDFLITALRVISYGPMITLTFDHKCNTPNRPHDYEISLESIFKKAGSIDPTSIASDYTFVCESGQVVKFKPTSFASILELSQNLDKMPSPDEEKSELATMTEVQKAVLGVLINMIEEVDGVTDKQLIGEWVNALPASWIKSMSDAIDKTSNWGVQFLADIKCKDCGEICHVPFSANPVSLFS